MILITILLVGNAVGWAVSLARAREAELQIDLATIPARIGDWQGTDVPQSKSVLRQLAGDALMQRIYTREDVKIDFWAVFGRDWRDLHAPESCYIASGWKIIGEGTVEVPAPEGTLRALNGRVFVARNGGAKVLALYLFATEQGTMANRAQLGWSLLQPGSGSCGLLLHAATAVEDGENLAAAEVTEFIRAVYPMVARLLTPTEAGAN